MRPTTPRLRAALLLLAIVLATIVEGRTASAREVGLGDHCACGQSCRGASCCCDHGAEAHPTPTTPTPLGPCLDAAPCGGQDVPTAAPTSPASQPAALGARSSPTPPAGVGRIAPIGPHRLLAPASPRLDDPPEAPLSA